MATVEYQFLQQRAKEKWLKYGDNPTKFFYNSMKRRQYRNQIVTLTNGDSRVEGQEQVENHLLEVFGKQMGREVNTTNIDSEVTKQGKVLTLDQQLSLIQGITDEEIWTALQNIEGSKSPGMDGYTSQFFKKTWAVVGEGVKKGVRSFFQDGELHEEFSRAVVTLIPKMEHPQQATDYRPIACCSVIYKLVTKIMSNRMRQILPEIITNNQGAFVQGRSISHNILLAQELLSMYKGGGTLIPSCMLKIDIRKAFDSISWKFIFQWLKALKFPGLFMNWIRKCVEGTTYCFSLNGYYTASFKGKRGVK